MPPAGRSCKERLATTDSTALDDLPTEVLATGVVTGGRSSALEEAGQEELSNNLTSAASSTTHQRLLSVRQSPISAARYNRWVVGERSREVGHQVRVQLEVLRTTKQEEDARVHAHGHLLSQQGRLQMERDRSTLEVHRQNNLQRAQRVREEMQALRQKEARDKQQWMESGRDLALQDRQQRMRIREAVGANAQRVSEMAALQKQEEVDYERNLRLVREGMLKDKRRAAAALRASTADEVINTSKRYAYVRRKDQAASTRSAEQSWREERSQTERSHLARARANKAAAEASRKRAKEMREKLEAARHAAASASRERLRKGRAEKEKSIMYASGGKLDTHDTIYRERYVPKPEAERMENSPYLSSVA